ncbi:unnamed protein product [Parnassius mnemosyne]|uniref:Uncharacterized protein n=1 Tax=Parnassius mnemosyne TaxID=213953 RepID=A0AAV1KBS3_9NEOP
MPSKKKSNLSQYTKQCIRSRQYRAKRVAEERAAWSATDDYQASDVTHHKDRLSIDNNQQYMECASKNNVSNSQCPKS